MLMFIHGVGMNRHNWLHQQSFFSNVSSCGFLDLPGHGNSGLGDQSLSSVADYADLIAKDLSSVSDELILIGHSLGSLVSCELAARCNEQVKGLVAVSTVYQRSDQALAAVQARAGSLCQSNDSIEVEPTLERWFGSAEDSNFLEQRLLCQQWLESVDQQAYAKAYSAFANTRGADSDTVRQIECPALFLTGSLDSNSTPEMSEQLANIAQRGQSKTIQGAAHMLQMTHVDEVNQSTHSFINEQISRF